MWFQTTTTSASMPSTTDMVVAESEKVQLKESKKKTSSEEKANDRFCIELPRDCFECSICFEEMKEVRTLLCGHSFCATCGKLYYNYINVLFFWFILIIDLIVSLQSIYIHTYICLYVYTQCNQI